MRFCKICEEGQKCWNAHGLNFSVDLITDQDDPRLKELAPEERVRLLSFIPAAIDYYRDLARANLGIIKRMIGTCPREEIENAYVSHRAFLQQTGLNTDSSLRLEDTDSVKLRVSNNDDPSSATMEQ